MNNLLFPVKLGPYLFVMLGGLVSTAFCTSCGYRSELAERPESELLSVIAGQSLIPDISAMEAAMSGARAELSRAGALKAGTAYPRLTLELLRVDEQGVGILNDQGRNQPFARASAIAVVGRAWITRAPGEPEWRDSGDLRRTEQYANSPDPREEQSNRDDAVRSAARRLGRSLARRLLGDPEPETEEL